MDMGLNVDFLVAVKANRFVAKYIPFVNAIHIRWRNIFVTLIYLLFHK